MATFGFAERIFQLARIRDAEFERCDNLLAQKTISEKIHKKLKDLAATTYNDAVEGIINDVEDIGGEETSHEVKSSICDAAFSILNFVKMQSFRRIFVGLLVVMICFLARNNVTIMRDGMKKSHSALASLSATHANVEVTSAGRLDVPLSPNSGHDGFGPKPDNDNSKQHQDKVCGHQKCFLVCVHYLELVGTAHHRPKRQKQWQWQRYKAKNCSSCPCPCPCTSTCASF